MTAEARQGRLDIIFAYYKSGEKESARDAADTFINLKDAEDEGRVRPGDRLLLFTFGFGANWACMVLEA